MTRPAWADFDIVSIPMAADPKRVAAELAERPDVEYAQARYRNHAMFRPNDEFYSLQWNLPALDMERAWDINPGASTSVTVAVLDSGVAYRDALVRYRADAFVLDGVPVYPALGLIDVPFAAAPDLAPTSRFVSPRDFIWDDDLPLDLDGHGTHVAGTIGQATNNGVGAAGMAFNVQIMPVKVIAELWDDIFGSPNFGTDDLVAQAIRYAADNGAHVINMSIGREAGGPAPAIEAAVQYAISRGAFVAIAAGNDGNGAESAQPHRRVRLADRRRRGGGRRGPRPRPRLLLDHRLLRGNRRPRRRHPCLRQSRAGSCSSRSIRGRQRPTSSARRCSGRRASTRSSSTTCRGRRWRRRTCRVSPRCSASKGSRRRPPSRPR